MFVDLEEKSVTFTADATLTLAQLYSLIDLLDDEDDGSVHDEDIFDRLSTGRTTWMPGWVLPDRIWTVQSHTTSKMYCTVHLEDGTWACSCPDWTYRHSANGDFCKHISRLRWLV